MFLVLTSSKGISSVVMSRILGVNQKTAWKLGHAIREVMDDRHAIADRLSGAVEADEAFVGTSSANHLSVQHNKRQYANRMTGVHINTVEAVNAVVQRALICVYHCLGRKHLQRYLDEIIWRWNHRTQEIKVRKRKSFSGSPSATTTIVWRPIPVVDQIRGLLCEAVGRQMRRTPSWDLRWP